VSKKSSQSGSQKNSIKAGKRVDSKGKGIVAPAEFQPHNAKKEALGPNTNR